MRKLLGPGVRAAIACLLLVPACVVALQTTASDARTVSLSKDALPERVGEWSGAAYPLTDRELSILQSPAASQRLYRAANGDTVQVLLIQVDNTQNAHDPRLCMDGEGYVETQSQEEPAPWSGRDTDNDVSHSVFSRDGSDRDMYYWMATDRGNIANMSTGLKLEGLRRALRGEPTKGIAVRLLAHPNAYDATRMTPASRVRELWTLLQKKGTIRF